MQIIDLTGNCLGVVPIIHHYPDGQISVEISDASSIGKTVDKKFTIYSRFRNYEDMMVFLSMENLLRENGATTVNLVVPYFLGALDIS